MPHPLYLPCRFAWPTPLYVATILPTQIYLLVGMTGTPLSNLMFYSCLSPLLARVASRPLHEASLPLADSKIAGNASEQIGACRVLP